MPEDYLQVHPYSWGHLARKPKSFTGSSDHHISSACGLHPHWQDHSTALSDYRPLDCSPGVASSRIQRCGGVSIGQVDQFARVSGEVQTPACSSHPLRHGYTYTSTNFQLKLTIPSSKTSSLADSDCWGYYGGKIGYFFISSVYLACVFSLEHFQSAYQW